MLQSIINGVKRLFGEVTLFYEATTYDGVKYKVKIPHVGVPDKGLIS